jgi:hypothetical protein
MFKFAIFYEVPAVMCTCTEKNNVPHIKKDLKIELGGYIPETTIR